MNIRNLVSTSLLQAGLDESDYDVSVRISTTRTSLYTSVRKKDVFKSIHMIIGLDENYVTDFVVSEENMSSVIGDDAYERFINRMTEETYIYV